MLYRLINLVLAVLMLMPAGICTCDGGVVSCPDHPVHAPIQSQICADGGQALGHVEAAVAAETGRDSQPHHCPAPRPHQPSCGAAAPEFLADSSASDISATLLVIDYAVVAEWPPPPPNRSDCNTAFTPLPAWPIYLAHCVLLI
ncbi:unnamed protein product [Gemmataceae bacterium]|nr:unnamed protein product [Gemmataceae bacterium]VTU01680.1 unnamed protein product [Gemmataceae bacterium]